MGMYNKFEEVLRKLSEGNVEPLYNQLSNISGEKLVFYKNELFNDMLSYLKDNIKPKKIDTIDDLAKLLNNNPYLLEFENPYDIDVERLCIEKKWVIVFPYSDDNIEIRGYVFDELGAYEGGNFSLVKKGDFYPDESEDNTYHKADHNMLIYNYEEPHIFMKWCDKEHQNYTWYIDTDYTDVAYFNIIDEDDEPGNTWARCCIIDCSNILN